MTDAPTPEDGLGAIINKVAKLLDAIEAIRPLENGEASRIVRESARLLAEEED